MCVCVCVWERALGVCDYEDQTQYSMAQYSMSMQYPHGSLAIDRCESGDLTQNFAGVSSYVYA